MNSLKNPIEQVLLLYYHIIIPTSQMKKLSLRARRPLSKMSELASDGQLRTQAHGLRLLTGPFHGTLRPRFHCSLFRGTPRAADAPSTRFLPGAFLKTYLITSVPA